MDFQLPELGEGIYAAELVEWLVQPGDEVTHGQALAEVMTDKATMELPSPFSGQIGELFLQPGEEMSVGQAILSYDPRSACVPSAEASSARVPRAEAPPDAEPETGNGESPEPATSVRVRAAPAVRRIADRLGVDLAQVPASGPSGRVLIDDLAQWLETSKPTAVERGTEERRRDVSRSHPGRIKDRTRDAYATFSPGTRIPLRGLRRKIAERMVHAKQTIPHYSYVDQCDVTDLVRLRASLKEPLSKDGVKLTYLAFVVKAVVGALRQVPLVNASLDEEAGEIVLHDRYHIGIAADTPEGLLVPVLRDADGKSLLQIARELESLTSAAKAGRLAVDDLRGSTFTVTSIGGIGGLISTPIINQPEVGILGIGRVVRQAVFDEFGNVRPADMLYLSFSFDHRVVDGAVAAIFGNAIIERLKNPARMLV